MPEQLVDCINQYGYAILFLLVFLQEIGVPSFPNEITLYYFGYLTSHNNLSLSLVLFIAIIADILGATLVYFSFYFFGKTFKKYRPSWINISSKKIKNLKLKMIGCKPKSILILRVTPFVRGYVSVLAGIIHLPFKTYIKQVILSAILWTGGWIILGAMTSKYFKIFLADFNSIYVVVFAVLIVVSVSLIKVISKINLKKKFRKY